MSKPPKIPKPNNTPKLNNKAKTEQKKKNLLLPITAASLGVILLAGLVVGVVLENAEDSRKPSNTLQYLVDGKLEYDNGAIVFDKDQQQGASDLYQEVEDGYISLSHKNQAYSTDGENYACYINNNPDNKYDIYVTVYNNQNADEMLYISGLIPPGSGIDHFKSEVKLDPGEYDALLVVTQVEDDHETIRGGQLFLALHLNVG